jgi:hypothetical protein
MQNLHCGTTETKQANIDEAGSTDQKPKRVRHCPKIGPDVDCIRLQLGEPVVGKLTEQLDRLASALRLYEDTTTMEPSPVPLRAISRAVRLKGLDLRIRSIRAVFQRGKVRGDRDEGTPLTPSFL